ncbi:zinc-binding alcohol dehydrogenase [Planomicrobium sp. Y74]|uniref:zinc-dependent alcohol dehydrogenase n=1 Tax=Planomicrobium sp. Y74 TaxID=2478977 RepID=UPI000EF4430E|nr:zinc-binding alcohol dehydrogenase [Planomicrobium sp. Y74]RLQ89867.1 alcohol dehydrogenase [Planomicrobium sp. Y74]
MIQRSLELTGKREMEWRGNEVPELAEDEVLIRTIATAISIGAELPQFQEQDLTNPIPDYPRKVGYESFGEILQTGSSVESLKTGDKAIAFYGQKNLGVVKAGQAFKVPENMDSKMALMAILSCDAAKGIRKLNPSKEAKVIVTGMGTMGLLSVYYLKKFYKVKHVDVVEPDSNRWNLAKSFGVSTIYSSDDHPHDYYDFGIECSAVNEGFATLQKAVKSHQEICVLSDGNKGTFTLQPEFFEKELRIVGSSDGWDYKEHMEWFLDSAKTAPYINEIFELEIDSTEIIECFRKLDNREINPVKILVGGW